MTHANVRGAIDDACSADQLDALSRGVWQAHAAGQLNDDEAQALLEAVQARRTALASPRTGAVQLGAVKSLFPPKRRQRAPERAVLIERRRAGAAAGWMPPTLASRFTLGEQSVLAVVAREIAQRGSCELCVDAIAALAGTSRRLVQAAIRLAYAIGLLRVEERRRKGDRNLSNRVSMLSREWSAWLKRRGGGGCKSLHPMSSDVHKQAVSRSVKTGNRATGMANPTSGAAFRDSRTGALGVQPRRAPETNILDGGACARGLERE